jgi:hypothetical protein
MRSKKLSQRERIFPGVNAVRLKNLCRGISNIGSRDGVIWRMTSVNRTSSNFNLSQEKKESRIGEGAGD